MPYKTNVFVKLLNQGWKIDIWKIEPILDFGVQQNAWNSTKENILG